MELEIIVAIIGLFGIAASALLGALGYFLKTRADSKKSARKVLYYLLEIRHAIRISLFDPADAYKKFGDTLEKGLLKRGIRVDRETTENLVGSMILQHFNNVAEASEVQLNEKIIEPYESALDEFSQIKPVLAYRLKGRERLQKVLSHTSNYSQQLVSMASLQLSSETNSSDARLLEYAKSQGKKSVSDMFSDMDDDILSVAWSCGIKEYFSCRALIRSSTQQPQIEFDIPQINEYLDECAAMIKGAA